MKWFKHMSCSHTDEKLCKLTDAYGLEGYGFYWFMLEKVSSILDATGQPEVTYSVKKWANSLDIPAQTFKKLTQKCCELGLFLCEFRNSLGEVQQEFVGRNNELLLTVKIPNLLKYRDNYSQDKKRNLEASSKELPSKEVEEEVEVDRDKKEGATRTPAKDKRQSVEKKIFGENGNVKLTMQEYERLCEKYGKEDTDDAITFLDLHIGAKGKDEYKNHNLALQKWVFDAVRERKAKSQTVSSKNYVVLPNGRVRYTSGPMAGAI